jgi:hypothetical protein
MSSAYESFMGLPTFGEEFATLSPQEAQGSKDGSTPTDAARSDPMNSTTFSKWNTAGEAESQLNSRINATREANGKNPFQVATAILAILLFSVNTWAGDHQICYQIPPLPGWHTIAARFACRTDGTNLPGCQVNSVVPAAGSPQILSFSWVNNSGISAESEATFSGAGTYVGTFTFADNTVRTCTVEIPAAYTLAPNSYTGYQNRFLVGFSTDASGLVMTGVWQATSYAADPAFQQVVVPPDFMAVGGGAEGAEWPSGVLVTSSIHYSSGNQYWSTGVHSNVPVQVGSDTAWGIGLKIEGIKIATLQQITQFPLGLSQGYLAHPSVTLAANVTYPQTTAAIGGGVIANQASSPNGQYVTESAPQTWQQCYQNGTFEQLVSGWTAASKDHINPSPWWVTAQMTTLPKVLAINGNTFHVETWVVNASSDVLPHPDASVGLPAGYALTSIGAFVNWDTSPTAAGNLIWRLKPRPDLNGAEAASKDQMISSPASITAYAIGMKLVAGDIPALCQRLPPPPILH